MKKDIFRGNSDDFSEMIGRSKPWMGTLLVCLSTLFLAAFFICVNQIFYQGRTILQILLEPMQRYFNMAK